MKEEVSELIAMLVLIVVMVILVVSFSAGKLVVSCPASRQVFSSWEHQERIDVRKKNSFLPAASAS